MSQKINNKDLLSRLEKNDMQAFLRALKDMLKDATAQQERSIAAMTKTIGKALAAFDEVNVLKMPSSGGGGGTTTQTETKTVTEIVVGAGANALLSLVSKMPAFTTFLTVLSKLPAVLSKLFAPAKQAASVFERITGIFRQTEHAGELVRKRTEAVTSTVARMSGAWNTAATSVYQWQKATKVLEEKPKTYQGIQNLTQQVRMLSDSFQNCTRVSNTTMLGIQKTWATLDNWFVSNVANPVIRDTNKMLTRVTGGFNQVFTKLGTETGQQIKPLSVPQIPHLARGAVLPANKPFLAVVGDQKNGTNVEAPLETIKQAVSEVMGRGDVVIRFTGDLAQLGRVLRPVIAKENLRVGGTMITKEVM